MFISWLRWLWYHDNVRDNDDYDDDVHDVEYADDSNNHDGNVQLLIGKIFVNTM